MTPQETKELLANYEKRLRDSGHDLQAPTRELLERKIRSLKASILTDAQFRQKYKTLKGVKK